MRNVAILLPGIVRNYERLQVLNNIVELGQERGINFYLFGMTYDFLGSLRTRKFAKKDSENANALDVNKLLLYPLTKLVVTRDIILKDDYGFCGRIYAQWKNIHETLNQAVDYAKTHGIVYDLIIRSRWDLRIKLKKMFEVIDISCEQDKLVVTRHGCRGPSDQMFMGPPRLMIDVCSMVNHYYEYLDTKFARRTKNRKPPTAKGKLKTLFPCQSEKLLKFHIENVTDWSKDVIYQKKWFIGF
jgi:hypothetical protein